MSKPKVKIAPYEQGKQLYEIFCKHCHVSKTSNN